MELDFSVQSFDTNKNTKHLDSNNYNLAPHSKEIKTYIKNPLKVKRVLLLFPPALTFKSARDINPLPPIGIGMLAAVLEKKNYDVQILDCLTDFELVFFL